ncbi:MAG: hypothetical protein ACR2HD_00680 [Solirubrobacteraceae bacterium]|nr:MAG: hypothetical protein DLM63_02410 [Solirubrobacterales bacterium]
MHQPAVALCRNCTAGLCMDHLRETAAHFARSSMLSPCQHDTGSVTKRRTTESNNPHARVDA